MERLEARVRRPLEKAGIGVCELDHVETAAGGQVEKLLAGREIGMRRQCGDGFDRPETSTRGSAVIGLLDSVVGAQVSLVIPATAGIVQNPRQPFAVEIDPVKATTT